MDPVTNPFVPGAGTRPPMLAGREGILEMVDRLFLRSLRGIPEKGILLVGLRGVGKTVLLNQVEEKAAERGFRTMMVEAHEEKSLPRLLLPQLKKILLGLDRGERVNRVVKNSLGVLVGFAKSWSLKYGDLELGLSLDPELGADSGDLELDLPELLLAVGRAAQARETGVALLIDEMQYLSEEELSALIMAMHKIAQKALPLVLIGGGLPQLVGLAGRSKSYAERLFDFPKIDALEDEDARRALRDPAQREEVDFEEKALDEILRVTQRFPFFLQEWGHQAWNHSPGSPISLDSVALASQTATRRLDESFFRVRFDRLTWAEKEYLFAMAKLGPGPHRTGDIAVRMDRSHQQLGPQRDSLIKKGMIFSPSYGEIAFTVPLFDQFLNRVRHVETS